MYIPLTKIYYEKPKQYEEIFHERQSSENSDHISFPYLADDVFFTYSKDVALLLADIYKINSNVKTLIQILPNAAMEAFERKCLIDEIMQTNGIEGVRSTRKEITLALVEQDKNKRFFGIVNKYLQLNVDIKIHSCEDIRKIYNDLVYTEIKNDNEASLPDGEFFRKEPVSVYSSTGKVIHKGITPELEIISAMEKALQLVNDDSVEKLISISIFHYLFAYIHPFYDGNGRTDRFISSYLLSKELNPLIGYRLSYTIKQNIKKYYSAFEITNDKKSKGDLTYFVVSFLEIIRDSMQNLYRALDDRNTKLSFYGELVKQIVNDSYKSKIDKEKYGQLFYLLIQVELFSKDGIEKKDICYHLHMSNNTVSEMLKTKPVSTLIKIDRKKRPYHYSIDLDKISELANQQ